VPVTLDNSLPPPPYLWRRHPPAPDAAHLKRLILEIHRRSLWQVLGIFLAASWGVLQVVEFITDTVGLPDWTPAMAMVLLLLGLPVCLATAFIQEGMPGGAAVDSEAPAGERSAADTDAPDIAAAPAEGVMRHLTWRNAVIGGLGAFTLLGVSLVGYFVLWTTGFGPQGSLVAQGVFEEGETVVLADFADPNGSGLGGVVTEALRVDLQESPVINLVPPSYVTGAMSRMGRDADAAFDATTARELAVRDGIKAVVQGEVAPVGSGYLLTASLVAAESGDILKAFRVPVASEDELLSGIDKLSQDIREKSGESLRSIKGGAPLEEATTSSLEALRFYTRAVEEFDAGRALQAIPLLEQALELDPDFAMAWRKLAVVLDNSGLDAPRVEEASRRAYELRGRLTEREAALAEAWYRSTVLDDMEGSIATYERLLSRYPEDGTALNNIAVRQMFFGRFDEAVEKLEGAASQPAGSDNVLSNLQEALWSAGRREDARATNEKQAAEYPDGYHLWYAGDILAAEGLWDAAHDTMALQVDRTPGLLVSQIGGRGELAGIDIGRGRWSEAHDHIDRARRLAVDEGAVDLYVQTPGIVDFWSSYVLEGADARAAALDRVLDGIVLDEVDPRSEAGFHLLWMLAAAGRDTEASAIRERFEASLPPERRGVTFRFVVAYYDAFRARAAREDEAAVEAFRRAQEEILPCAPSCVFSAERGRALEGAGRPDEAIEQYERHLASNLLIWVPRMAAWTPLVLERLGALYAERGDTALAVERLERLVSSYQDGDGPFVPFVKRAKARLVELSAGGR
jgi:eukaryotic-like serine/threonine-protein kinase